MTQREKELVNLMRTNPQFKADVVAIAKEFSEFDEMVMLVHKHPEAISRLLEIAKEESAAAPAVESIEATADSATPA